MKNLEKHDWYWVKQLVKITFSAMAICRYYPRIQKPIKKKKLIRKLTLIMDKEEEEEQKNKNISKKAVLFWPKNIN